MTEEERIEFKATISAQASQIVQNLMKSDLGPTDAAFCLGAAAALIGGVIAQLKNKPIEETRAIVLDAVMGGFENTQADVILIKSDGSNTH